MTASVFFDVPKRMPRGRATIIDKTNPAIILKKLAPISASRLPRINKVIIESRTDFGEGRKKDSINFREVTKCQKTRKTNPPMKDNSR